MSERAVELANAFLAVLWDAAPPDDGALAAALDHLLAGSHSVRANDGVLDDRDPPEQDSRALYEQIAARFPAYGYYNVADPTAKHDTHLLVGDAVDDLADITRDLREVVWRGTNIGPDDADWYFRLLYFHWGRHARELSLYLHARLSN